MKVKYFARASALFLFISLFLTHVADAQPVIFTGKMADNIFRRNVQVILDSANKYTPESVINTGGFKPLQGSNSIYFLHDQALWGRFSLQNGTENDRLFFCILYPNISNITFYKLNSNNSLDTLVNTGNATNFASRLNTYVNFCFDLRLHPKETGTYYFRIKSQHPVELRPSLLTNEEVVAGDLLQSIIMAAYLGILISVFLYNIFLYFATADKSYIAYVCYILMLTLAQLTLSGWAFKYLWPGMPWLNNYAVIWTSNLTGIATIVFAFSFLRTATYLPRAHKVLLALIGVIIVSIALSFTSLRLDDYQLLNFSAVASGVILLYVSGAILAKGFRPALYYLLAWSAFLLGLIILVFRNLGIIPTVPFTTYILYVGSAVEAILLSIALADKISVLRKEKEVSQANALRISQENETLVKEQNLVLEQKVAERTDQLQLAHTQVSLAYKDLKDAQIQLVEAEKMASLGVLTAGIAHEINNPINFVKSNIKPLQLDFKDLMLILDEYETLHHSDQADIGPKLTKIRLLQKQIDLDFVKDEIENLMKGIENGAERTAEIVRGLRIFSRLDESEIKTADIHEGLDSTLILLRSNIPPHIAVVKEYEADGVIECFPGRLNQAFVNILTNAIQAVKSKPHGNREEKIVIATRNIGTNKIEIKISDSGVGMSEDTRQKIFEPFFTTKQVGEGTGLGLAIVFKVIQEHFGTINVISAEGKGSQFILNLNSSIPKKGQSNNYDRSR